MKRTRRGRAESSRQEVATPLPRAACILAVTAWRPSCRSNLKGLEAALTTRPEAALLTSPTGGGAEKGDTGGVPGERDVSAFHLPPCLKCGQALEVSRASAGGRDGSRSSLRLSRSGLVCLLPGVRRAFSPAPSGVAQVRTGWMK